MARKKKDQNDQPTSLDGLVGHVAKAEEEKKDNTFEPISLETELPLSEDIVTKYKFVEKARFFRDGKEFIVITLTGHNI